MGLSVFVCAQVMGGISGGHFNPAVTIGVLFREGKTSNLPFALAIIFSQIFGAILGVSVAYGCQYFDVIDILG